MPNEEVNRLAAAAIEARALRGTPADYVLVLEFPDWERRQEFVVALEDYRQAVSTGNRKAE